MIRFSCRCGNAIEVEDDLAGGDAQCTACGLLTYQGNAVDQAGFGELIGHYQAAWFTAPESGDFHLTAAGASAIGATATWAPGDPELDIDDSPRPSDRAGSPGIDEP